jgi:ABC-type lipoprotein export system ATPase subunit
MVVVVTHDTDVAALADTSYTLRDGKLLEGESPTGVPPNSPARE